MNDEIRGIETIAVGSRIRELDRLVESFGKGRWRKLKGTARAGRARAWVGGFDPEPWYSRCS